MIRRFLKSENGQSMAEFALIVPVLLSILCGIVDLGWAYSNQYQVENAAYAGARYATINSADIDKIGEHQLIEDTKQRVEENLGKGAINPTITVTIDDKKITVDAKCQIQMLTYVGQTFFGKYYDAESTSVGAR